MRCFAPHRGVSLLCLGSGLHPPIIILNNLHDVLTLDAKDWAPIISPCITLLDEVFSPVSSPHFRLLGLRMMMIRAGRKR